MSNILDFYLSLCGEKAPLWNLPWPEQGVLATRIRALVATEPTAFVRTCFPAHVTGSAFVVDEELGSTLLLHHRKLGKWMQPGGHSDGDPETHRVAFREAQEETGIASFTFLPLPGVLGDAGVAVPFDVDIHSIPPHKTEPQHEHFDLRYLLLAPSGALPIMNNESLDLRWVPFERVEELTQEESVLRMVRKVFLIKKSLSQIC